MDFNELLPIGSVVILKGAEKRLMVFGVGQTDEAAGIDYDYIGVMYPEGNMGEGTQYLFNHPDIEKVFFRGYDDEERSDFVARLQQFYEDNK